MDSAKPIFSFSGSTLANSSWGRLGVAPESDKFTLQFYSAGAGNGGTVALEILADLPDVRTVVAPVGGGGLVAGLAAARRLEGARFTLVGVQSEACPAMVRSLEAGRALLEFEGAPTLAEGLEGGVSETTYAVARDELAPVVRHFGDLEALRGLLGP